jgi:hypothetical protein
VDPVPDPLLLRKSGRAGNRTRTSGSVARNYDHQTTDAESANLRQKSRNIPARIFILVTPASNDRKCVSRISVMLVSASDLYVQTAVTQFQLVFKSLEARPGSL